MYCKFYEGKQLEIIFSGLSFYVYYFSATVIYKDAIFSAFVITFFFINPVHITDLDLKD